MEKNLINKINKRRERENIKKANSIKVKILAIFTTIITIALIIAIKECLSYKTEVLNLVSYCDTLGDDALLYKSMYNSMLDTNATLTDHINALEAELQIEKDNLAIAKDAVEKYKLTVSYNESKSPEYRDLRIFEPMSEEELNDWIKEKAPSSSPFIGRADVFIEASEETGLDPRYIVAHAGVESAWGTSTMALTKGNYFGIGAFNSSPSSAYSFASHGDDILHKGIVGGAIWIKTKYIDKGKVSLHDFLYKGAAYAQYDDGSPNTGWMLSISNIMK